MDIGLKRRDFVMSANERVRACLRHALALDLDALRHGAVGGDDVVVGHHVTLRAAGASMMDSGCRAWRGLPTNLGEGA